MFDLPEWATRMVIVGIVIAAAIAVLALLRAAVPAVSRRLTRGAAPAQVRQRQTAVGLLATTLRYLVLIGAGVALVVTIVGGGVTGALSGGALLILIVGFASQRLLADVVGGFFVLFENQYGVGDMVRLEPSGVMGVVEELGPRVTVLREPNGDRSVIPHGQVSSVRRLPRVPRQIRVHLMVTDAGAVREALERIDAEGVPGGARFVVPPRVESAQELAPGAASVWVWAAVVPAFEWLVREYLVAALRALLGDRLLADPVVVTAVPESMLRLYAGLPEVVAPQPPT